MRHPFDTSLMVSSRAVQLGPDRPVRPVVLAVALMVACVPSAAACAEDDSGRQQVGQRIIDFELPVVGSEQFLTLSKEYAEGDVVVIVLRGYPGYQCPICTRQVGSLANRARALAKEAHRVILVYPGSTTELRRRAEEFLGTRTLPEPLIIVRDEGMELVQRWGLRWDARNETAYPATFVIDRNGRIRWKKVSQSHAGRSTVEEILQQLRKI